MVKKIGIWVLVLGLVVVFFVGCAANVQRRYYRDRLEKGNMLLKMGGDQKAPYETAKVRYYLEAYKKEMDEGDWKGADQMRQKVDMYLDQAMQKVQ